MARRELGEIYAQTKTEHEDFLLGSRFGFAAAILTSSQYINAYNRVCPIGDELGDDWEFIIPDRPPTVHPDLADADDDGERRSLEAHQKAQIAEWDRFDAHEYVFKGALIDAFDEQYTKALKDDVLGYSHVCVSEILDHLRSHCLEITDVEKDECLEETRKPWDLNDEITTYFLRLDKMQEDLADDDIEFTTRQKITQAVKQMYASRLFDKKDMTAWEKKPTADKTWVRSRE